MMVEITISYLFGFEDDNIGIKNYAPLLTF